MKTKAIKDYSIKMQDATGKVCEISINADSIRELMADGYSKEGATESVEGNAFANAIHRGEIGADAWQA